MQRHAAPIIVYKPTVASSFVATKPRLNLYPPPPQNTLTGPVLLRPESDSEWCHLKKDLLEFRLKGPMPFLILPPTLPLPFGTDEMGHSFKNTSFTS